MSATTNRKERMKTIERYLKYQFTEAEIREKATRLADLCRKHEEAENEKKQVVSDFKAKIDALVADISRVSNHINNGYEYRQIQCSVEMDAPAVGQKTVTRVDTGEIVCVEPMTTDEMQRVLPFEEK